MLKVDGQKLLLERAKSGITAKELSILANVAPNTISRIENGRSKPKPSTIGKIAKALNIKLEELIIV